MKRWDFEIGGYVLIAMMLAVAVMTVVGIVRQGMQLVGLG